MNIADRVREVTETLPSEKQAEVLDFVEFLRNRTVQQAVAEDAMRKAKLRAEGFGALRGAFSIAPDFDAPLSEDILRDEGTPSL